jgi:hypothetical protein
LKKGTSLASALPTGSGLPPTKNRQLTPRAPQRSFQSLLLLIPAGFFGLRSLLEGLDLGLDRRGPLRVLLLGLLQRSLRLVDAC